MASTRSPANNILSSVSEHGASQGRTKFVTGAKRRRCLAVRHDDDTRTSTMVGSRISRRRGPSSSSPFPLLVTGSLLLMALLPRGLYAFLVRPDVVRISFHCDRQSTNRLRAQHHHDEMLKEVGYDRDVNVQASPRSSNPLESSTFCESPMDPSRRTMLTMLVTAMAASTAANAAPEPSSLEPLEQLALGRGEWIPLTTSPPSDDMEDDNSSTSTSSNLTLANAAFTTYLTRFLISYDPGVHQWWLDSISRLALLSDAEQTQKLTAQFAALSRSIQQADLLATLSPDGLWDWLVQQYASSRSSNAPGEQEDVMRQIALLFALLPPAQQPTRCILSYLKSRKATEDTEMTGLQWDATNFAALLPSPFRSEVGENGSDIQIVPDISSLSNGARYTTLLTNKQWLETPFGPLGSNPLTREIPKYSTNVYTLLGISGAVGCALTHSVVIPLDVVKTRAQTNPEMLQIEQQSTETSAVPTKSAAITSIEADGSLAVVTTKKKNIVTAAVDIVQTEGLEALLLGAQATIVGYLWYGLSVYPSYTFFKRFLSLEVLPPDVVLVQGNNIALLAGALAAVVASLGLTPIEAARIRVVAEPDIYRPLGLVGTLRTIAEEDETLGWKSLYAGLPSLLARQVIFGSVKFLAFERACDVIFAAWPFLRDLTWTSLTVSLVAGGFSGTLSSVVSQPADSLLTFVAQNSNSNSNSDGVAGDDVSSTSTTTKPMGLIEGCRIMIEQEGPGSLFRGLGSRCVWAGSIIAGQFLLYDVFRQYFHVSSNDLSQVYHVSVNVLNVS